jgi:serine/threonine-protein kinase
MPESGDSITSRPTRPLASDAAADAGRVHDVFISYASQDAATASTIVTALERTGLHCWIAPRDVAPGSQYADGIIRAINGAKLLVLVLSEHAVSSPHVGKEIERASSKQRPIIALRTDATPLTPALEYFLSESQWIDVGGGGTDAASAKLVEAVQRLITQPSHHTDQENYTEQGHQSEHGADAARPAAAAALSAPVNRRSSLPTIALIVLGAATLAYLVADKVWLSKRAAVTPAESTPASQNAPGAAAPGSGSAPSAFAPPPHSIAVLPFVNMSGDPKQDYFSDGLSEELLNSLAAIPDLRVAARTSSFTFKGKNDDVADIARKLNVGALLEGSVRKDGNQVRITAQLINATTGYHLWSQTYDRDLKNVLALQWEIATAVTKALKATLLTDAATAIEIGGTQNPVAFDAYLRGKHLQRGNFDKENTLARIAAFSEAARLDPRFAKAYVGAANAQNTYANNFAPGSEVRSWFKQARGNSEKAIALAPELGEAHAAMAGIWERGYLDFARAQAEYDRALALSPNDTEVLLRSGTFFVTQGRAEAGLSNIRSAIALDQLNPEGYARLSIGLTYAHQYREAIEADERTLQFNPSDFAVKNSRGMNYLLLGELDAARESCDTPKRSWQGRLCMSILYDKLHRQSEAEAELAAMQAELGDSASYQYAEIYAQWGNVPKALDWLDTAYRLPDPGIGTLRVDSLVDRLRKEPRFQEIERKLKFPI